MPDVITYIQDTMGANSLRQNQSKPQAARIVMSKTKKPSSSKSATSKSAGQSPKANGTPVTGRMDTLGIPKKDLTPAVETAVAKLLDTLDTTTRELSRANQKLAELEKLVDVDCTPPTPNRSAFLRRLSWAIAMHERYGHPSAVLFFDINNFKLINEQHGREAGDATIRHIAQTLQEMMRESDFLARIESDDFAVLMYYASAEAAHERGRQIVDKLSHNSAVYNGKPISLTAAYGVYSVKSGDDAESALTSAAAAITGEKRQSKALTDAPATAPGAMSEG